MSTGLLVIRIVLGGLFIGHGTQKLFGWFGGHGPAGTGKFFESIGYRPGPVMAVLAGLGEAGGGMLVLLGFMTPLGAVAIVAVMVGTLAVHFKNGLWNTEGGFEYPLMLAAAAIMLGFTGPGRFSMDAAIGWKPWGLTVGFVTAAIGLALGMGMLVMRARQRVAAREEEPQAPRRAA
jgi:putative oxidoreductase